MNCSKDAYAKGWSPPGTSLLNADGSERNKEEWDASLRERVGRISQPYAAWDTAPYAGYE